MSCCAVEVIDRGVLLLDGRISSTIPGVDGAGRGTITRGILAAHHSGKTETGNLRLRFDALASHDITYVGIIQTARACGLKAFPVPYVLTNCHNSLCAVGGTINGDDHIFGLSAAKKYGGIYVPPHLAVIHSYMREAWAGCGKMILGSDSHTRYGALGTLAVGEGGGELVKQLLCQTYDTAWPKVIAVYLEGAPLPGVGPMDAALALIGAVFKNGFAKNAVLEFTGPGIASLSAEFRNGIDVMTTETACWSSIWETDEIVRAWLALHGREEDYRELKPAKTAHYNGAVKIDLGKLRPMIAMPFHPANVYELGEFLKNPADIFRQVEKDAAGIFNKNLDLGLMEKIDEQGRVRADQGIIAGCAGGTFDNITAAADILGAGQNSAGAFGLSVYPGSQSIYLELARNGTLARLAAAGAVVKTAFCGPCFGAGEVPPHRGFSVRHTTRNFPNREGSKPNQGQIASVALMDARSVAAAARNGGALASPEDYVEAGAPYRYRFDPAPYRIRVYNGFGKAGAGELVYGPNIGDWPPMEALGKDLLLKIAAFITDPVTTTDELIPSGETSSYRSNPEALAEFTLSRKDPAYVGRAKAFRAAARRDFAAQSEAGETADELETVLRALDLKERPQIASAIFAVKPGDGSAREQAASCQRILGGGANFANEYATRRYRNNLINWGLIPFLVEGNPPFENGDYVFIPEIRLLIRGEKKSAEVRTIRPRCEQPGEKTVETGVFSVAAPELDSTEREILLAGSLINYNLNKYNGEGGSAKALEREKGR
jgi:aconitate hydratase